MLDLQCPRPHIYKSEYLGKMMIGNQSLSLKIHKNNFSPRFESVLHNVYTDKDYFALMLTKMAEFRFLIPITNHMHLI